MFSNGLLTDFSDPPIIDDDSWARPTYAFYNFMFLKSCLKCLKL